MITDTKIAALTNELNALGCSFILIAEMPDKTNPTSRISSITHSLDNNLTERFVTLAATFAKKAKERPELMQMIRLVNEFINDTDETFLENCVQEVK